MRISNVFYAGDVRAAVRLGNGRRCLVRDLDPALPPDAEGLLAGGHLPHVAALATGNPDTRPVPDDAPGAAVVRRPGKIMGIGLNYIDHADDLSAPRPDEPAVFLKAAHTVIGPQEPIPLPPQSDRVTAEAELALVIGRPAWQVDEAAALQHVAGAVCVLDQTAEDILQRNPRFLVRSKNFPGFMVIGSELVTLDELETEVGSLAQVGVETHVNGELHRRNVVENMTFSPAHLVSFLSHVMPLDPGDVLATGTPGAAVISDGDEVSCHVDGVGDLTSSVVVQPAPGRRVYP